MIKQSTTQQLHSQPFITYRDPKTGRWMVLKAQSNTAQAIAA